MVSWRDASSNATGTREKDKKSKDGPRGHWIMDRGAFRVLVLKRNESRLTAPWSRTRATASYEADGNWGQTHRSGGQMSRMTATVFLPHFQSLALVTPCRSCRCFPARHWSSELPLTSVDPILQCIPYDLLLLFTSTSIPNTLSGNSATTSPSRMVTSRLPTSWVSPMAPRVTTTSENEVTHSSQQMAIWLVSSKVATCA
ncbi:hypothetical protein BDV34DRAFT_232465 [Aspergillus parasiticus]|uniref:Uncharacterized protein n=1 Tax=Aspergillus parasiticus TaxID=5067 RepID=A0A5N6D4E5_ASPPA|nr:hypothetical protein BDV34DRAFT_232465 [Aspergillus parasiticus]